MNEHPAVRAAVTRRTLIALVCVSAAAFAAAITYGMAAGHCEDDR